MVLRCKHISFLLFVSIVHQTWATCNLIQRRRYLYEVTSYQVSMHRLYKAINCDSINSEQDLTTHLKPLLDQPIDMVRIVISDIPEIPKDVFQNSNISRLELGDLNLQTIQEGSFVNASISVIKLDNNKIRSLTENCFQNSTNILELSLVNNSLTELSLGSFVGLSNLTRLSLQNNGLTYIYPDVFKPLFSLVDLNLSFNLINNIDSRLFQTLTKLNSINMNNNYLKKISKSIFINNTELQLIEIANNYIENLDFTLFPNSTIYINVSKNSISKYNFSNLPNIGMIDLSFNSIIDIDPEAIYGLKNLKKLFINNNYIGFRNSVNETCFQEMPNLEIINLSHNYFKKLDFKYFIKNTNLKEIYVTNNKLTQLDFSFFPSKIISLNISSNQIKIVTNISNLNQLRELDLSGNKLEEVEVNHLNNLNKLITLNLQSNNISSLHLGCFRDLTSLTELNLANNNVTSIESGVFNGLNKIKFLDLSHNKLSILDGSVFHNLGFLTTLNISYNNLNDSNVEDILVHTPYLREINLMGNHWTCSVILSIYRKYKSIKITNGNDYDVRNVFGMACENNNTSNQLMDNEKFNAKMYDVADKIKSSHDHLQNKLTTSNVMLVMIFIFFVVKFAVKYYYPIGKNAQQFSYKKTPEEELQLV